MLKLFILETRQRYLNQVPHLIAKSRLTLMPELEIPEGAAFKLQSSRLSEIDDCFIFFI